MVDLPVKETLQCCGVINPGGPRQRWIHLSSLLGLLSGFSVFSRFNGQAAMISLPRMRMGVTAQIRATSVHGAAHAQFRVHDG